MRSRRRIWMSCACEGCSKGTWSLDRLSSNHGPRTLASSPTCLPSRSLTLAVNVSGRLLGLRVREPGGDDRPGSRSIGSRRDGSRLQDSWNILHTRMTSRYVCAILIRKTSDERSSAGTFSRAVLLPMRQRVLRVLALIGAAHRPVPGCAMLMKITCNSVSYDLRDPPTEGRHHGLPSPMASRILSGKALR